jgi:anti-sigma factor RsiW
MVDQTPVTEYELHLYVDGELPVGRREAVEAWLANHPEDAARIASWREQAELVRARYAHIAEEPVPDKLKLATIMRTRRSWGAIAAAAAIVAFFVGGIAGWVGRGASAAAPSESEVFTSDAMVAHRLYISEVRHPIEVKAEEDHLLPWLSRRVGTTLRAPDLSAFGLKLLGGRLLPGVASPAALFMYEGGSGERYTIYCSKVDTARTSFRYEDNTNFGSVRWIEGNYGWALSGPKDRDLLKSIASAAYDQIENRPPPTSRSEADQLLSRRGS